MITQARLHGIIFNIPYGRAKMLLVAYKSVEGFFEPEPSLLVENSV
jgi:hypothetical protein